MMIYYASCLSVTKPFTFSKSEILGALSLYGQLVIFVEKMMNFFLVPIPRQVYAQTFWLHLYDGD